MPHRARIRRLPTALAAITALIVSAPDVLAQPALGSGAVVAIRNVNVLPMHTERIALNQTVIVRGPTIERVGRAQDTPVPPGATVIEGHGKYLAPGLADMHVHLADPNEPPGTAEAELMLFLANGVTTVRSMRGFPSHLELRDKVASGEVLGPAFNRGRPRT